MNCKKTPILLSLAAALLLCLAGCEMPHFVNAEDYYVYEADAPRPVTRLETVVTADTIAEKLGFEKEKYVRLRSGLLYTLNRLSEEGHCYATRAQLLKTGAELPLPRGTVIPLRNAFFNHFN